jgi:hypothetical protein
VLTNTSSPVAGRQLGARVPRTVAETTSSSVGQYACPTIAAGCVRQRVVTFARSDWRCVAADSINASAATRNLVFATINSRRYIRTRTSCKSTSTKSRVKAAICRADPGGKAVATAGCPFWKSCNLCVRDVRMAADARAAGVIKRRGWWNETTRIGDPASRQTPTIDDESTVAPCAVGLITGDRSGIWASVRSGIDARIAQCAFSTGVPTVNQTCHGDATCR